MTPNQSALPRLCRALSTDVGHEIIEAYFAAKEAVLFYETREKTRALQAVTEFRDALDHMMLAGNRDTDEDCLTELITVREHLRRAAVEPLEHAVEDRLDGLLERQRLLAVSRVLFVPVPDNDEVWSQIQTIQVALQRGRSCKEALRWRDAVVAFKEGYEACNALDRLLPAREVYAGRFYGLVVAVAMLLLGTLFGWLISR